MNEIEIKFLEINKKKVFARLKSLKAKKVFDGKMEAVHFDYPDGKLEKNSIKFRLRKKGKENYSELTLKKKVNNRKFKHMKEYEIATDDFKTLRQILKLIGFIEIHHYTKHRQSFSVKDFHVEIDKYSSIPLFAELEAKSKKSLEKAVRLMGFNMKDGKPLGVRELMKHYRKPDN